MKKNILFINKEVFNKINLYHSIVGSIEWSGSILIKPEISDNVITYNVIDIIIECIGVSGSFETSPTEFKNFANNPEFDKCMIGLVHSHHSMGAFVSSVDEEELKESPFYPYISLVVAFNQRFVAKEAYKLEETYRTYTLFNGKSTKIKEDSKIITLDLEVKIEGYDKALEEVNIIKPKTMINPYISSYINQYNDKLNGVIVPKQEQYKIKNQSNIEKQYNTIGKKINKTTGPQRKNYRTYNENVEFKLKDIDISFIAEHLGIKAIGRSKNKDIRKEIIDVLVSYYKNNQGEKLQRFLDYLDLLDERDLFFNYLKQSKHCTPYILSILDEINDAYLYKEEYDEYKDERNKYDGHYGGYIEYDEYDEY